MTTPSELSLGYNPIIHQTVKSVSVGRSARVKTTMMLPNRSSMICIPSVSTTGFQNIVMNVMELLLDITNMFGHSAHFQFRFDVHLVIQVRLDTVFGSLPVLADQDKNGKKD